MESEPQPKVDKQNRFWIFAVLTDHKKEEERDSKMLKYIERVIKESNPTKEFLDYIDNLIGLINTPDKLLSIITETKERIYKKSLDSVGLEHFSKMASHEMISSNSRFNKIIKKRIVKNCSYLKDFDSRIKNIVETLDIKRNIEKSKKLYFSVITQTDWYEELIESNSCMGLLVRVNSGYMGKLGYSLSDITVSSVTQTVVPAKQIFDIHNMYHKITGTYDDGFKRVPLISGNGVGNGNSVIPLYINKYHWQVAKHYLRPMLGITVSQNPATYTQNHINILFKILMKMVSMTFTESLLSDRWIHLLFSLYRTCYQVVIERQMAQRIRSQVKNFMDDVGKRTPTHLESLSVFMGKLLTLGCKFKSIDSKGLFMEYLLEEGIRRNLIKERLLTSIMGFFLFSDMVQNYDVLDQDKNDSLVPDKALKVFKIFIDTHRITANYPNLYKLVGKQCKDKVINAYVAQGVLHRSTKQRNRAIKNKKYIDPRNHPDKVIKNCGLVGPKNFSGRDIQ